MPSNQPMPCISFCHSTPGPRSYCRYSELDKASGYRAMHKSKQAEVRPRWHGRRAAGHAEGNTCISAVCSRTIPMLRSAPRALACLLGGEIFRQRQQQQAVAWSRTCSTGMGCVVHASTFVCSRKDTPWELHGSSGTCWPSPATPATARPPAPHCRGSSAAKRSTRC